MNWGPPEDDSHLDDQARDELDRDAEEARGPGDCGEDWDDRDVTDGDL